MIEVDWNPIGPSSYLSTLQQGISCPVFNCVLVCSDEELSSLIMVNSVGRWIL